MEYSPHGYQRYAADFILSRPASALMLQMGLGKTVTTLTALDALLFDRFEARRVLVIAPLRVCAVWEDEIRKWDHLGALTLANATGSAEKRRKAIETDSDIAVINRENVPWLVSLCATRWVWDTVVIDELSGFKNHRCARFRALMKVRGFVR